MNMRFFCSQLRNRKTSAVHGSVSQIQHLYHKKCNSFSVNYMSYSRFTSGKHRMWFSIPQRFSCYFDLQAAKQRYLMLIYFLDIHVLVLLAHLWSVTIASASKLVVSSDLWNKICSHKMAENKIPQVIQCFQSFQVIVLALDFFLPYCIYWFCIKCWLTDVPILGDFKKQKLMTSEEISQS